MEAGKNFFGEPLGPQDHAYDPSNFATKVRSVGVWFAGTEDGNGELIPLALPETPRVYLIPVGTEYLSIPNSESLEVRAWKILDQKIPAPLPGLQADLNDPNWRPIEMLDDLLGETRKFSSFRAYHDSGFFDEGDMTYDSRLVGRSVWNSSWLLIIPGRSLNAEPDDGLDNFIYGPNGTPRKPAGCLRHPHLLPDLRLLRQLIGTSPPHFMKLAITTTSAVLLLLLAAGGQTLPEPDTVIYGKVLNRHGPSEHLMTEGDLEWTILRTDGTELSLDGHLEKLSNGQFSYRLHVPHHAVSLGLVPGLEGIPLTLDGKTFSHLQITVDGEPATILSPGKSEFDLEQNLRGGTLRVDLAVSYPEADGDGDGMPDWWEEAHGLDSQSNDAGGDPDGDGRSNLDEYLNGSDPNHDSRVPRLVTAEVIAYEDRTSGVMLEVEDTDTEAGAIVFTVEQRPTRGVLARDGEPLAPGQSFTLQEVQEGALSFVDSGGPADEQASITLRLHDGTPEHEPTVSSVTVHLYHPGLDPFDAPPGEELVAAAMSADPVPGAAPDEDLEARAHILGDAGAMTIWDLQAVASDLTLAPREAAPAPARFILGGTGADSLSGTDGDDWLVGGPGGDVLTGGMGSDRFVVASMQDGDDRLVDFNPEEGDVLDLSALLVGTERNLAAYLELTASADHFEIGVDVDGDGSGFTDLTVSIDALSPEWADLHTLWAGGHILSRGLTLPPRLSISPTVVQASENYPDVPGVLTIARSGDHSVPLTVTVQFGGSAENGVDYAHVASTVTFPAHQDSVAIEIHPFQDAVSEPSEVVEVRLLAGSGYELGAAQTARITIEDLKPLIAVEAVESVAIRDSGQPAAFLLSRSGLVQQSVFVRLTLSGTATAGIDYQGIPLFVNLAAGQTSHLISIQPRPEAVLEGGVESVLLGVAEQPSYLRGHPATARAMIVEKELRFADWQEKFFPAGGDPGTNEDRSGLSLLERYAFGLDPSQSRLGSKASGLPQTRLVDGHLTLSFHREFAATDLDYVVEVSSNLSQWRTGPEFLEEVLTDSGSHDREHAVFRARKPVSENPDLFLRVRVTRRP